MAAEIEEKLKFLGTRKGVVGYMVLNSEQIAIKSTFDELTTVLYSNVFAEIARRARKAVADLDFAAEIGTNEKKRKVVVEHQNANELTLARLRTLNNEVVLIPDNEFVLMLLQEPTE